jgi:hypothetical protein
MEWIVDERQEMEQIINNGIPPAAGVIYQNGDNTTSPQGLVELFQKRSENIWGSWIWDHRDH